MDDHHAVERVRAWLADPGGTIHLTDLRALLRQHDQTADQAATLRALADGVITDLDLANKHGERTEDIARWRQELAAVGRSHTGD